MSSSGGPWSVQLRPGPARHAEPLPVLTGDADARALLVLGVHEHHVGDVDRAFLLDHAADGLGALGPRHLLRAHVALDDVQALDVDAVLLRVDAHDPAGLALVLARDDDDLVVAADLGGHGQSTSGARETIFMKLRSRSSRATGPKMRVPRGLFCASMITAAFSSNWMYVPSSRPNSFLVRTTTAVTTSPFFTLPCGMACLTVATIVSPTPA